MVVYRAKVLHVIVVKKPTHSYSEAMEICRKPPPRWVHVQAFLEFPHLRPEAYRPRAQRRQTQATAYFWSDQPSEFCLRPWKKSSPVTCQMDKCDRWRGNLCCLRTIRRSILEHMRLARTPLTRLLDSWIPTMHSLSQTSHALNYLSWPTTDSLLIPRHQLPMPKTRLFSQLVESELATSQDQTTQVPQLHAVGSWAPSVSLVWPRLGAYSILETHSDTPVGTLPRSHQSPPVVPVGLPPSSPLSL